MTKRFRPRFDSLESRALLSAAAVVHEWPASAIGPIQPGWIRDVTLAMTFNPTAPLLGFTFQASLSGNVNGPFTAMSTTWTDTVTYGGFTSPPASLPGAIWNVSITATIPGTYTVTAVTTWMSTNPTVLPPAPTPTTARVTVPVPSAVVKFSGMGTEVPPGTIITVADDIFAGGQPMGGSFAGYLQEFVPPSTYFDGSMDAGTGGWWQTGSGSFYLAGGTLYDQQMYPGTTPGGTTWADTPVGTICTWSQQLQAVWYMPTTVGTNARFSVNLTTLSWTWSKVNATQWTTN
jgi:hypothetical protein